MMIPIIDEYGSVRNVRQAGWSRYRSGGVLLVSLLLALSATVAPGAQTGGGRLYDQAIEAMQYDDIDAAVPLLEAHLQATPADADAVRVLAYAYERSGRTDSALALLERATADARLSDAQRALTAFDRGGALARGGRWDQAQTAFSEAIAFDSDLSRAYLNRANAALNALSFEQAATDYRLYLVLEPATPQRPQIERVLALLESAIEEERQAVAERERLEAERERRAEIARQEAEERRRSVLDSILDSLGSAGGDAESFELDNEDLETYEDDLDIVD